MMTQIKAETNDPSHLSSAIENQDLATKYQKIT